MITLDKNIETIIFNMFNKIISGCISNDNNPDDFGIYKEIKYNAVLLMNKVALVMAFCVANRNSAMNENDQELVRNMAKDFLESCIKNINDVTLVSFDITKLDEKLQNEATKIMESDDNDENIVNAMREFIEKNHLKKNNIMKNKVEIL